MKTEVASNRKHGKFTGMKKATGKWKKKINWWLTVLIPHERVYMRGIQFS